MNPYLLREIVVHDAGHPSNVEVPVQVQPLGGAPGGAGVFRRLVVHLRRQFLARHAVYLHVVPPVVVQL